MITLSLILSVLALVFYWSIPLFAGMLLMRELYRLWLLDVEARYYKRICKEKGLL